MYCKKLEVIFPDIDISRITGGTLIEGFGETFRTWNLRDLDYFNNILASTIKFNIPPNLISYTEISGFGAEPHSEKLKTVLNYYIDPGKCVTMFWKLKENAEAVQVVPSLNNNNVWVESATKRYDPKTLTYEQGFIARPFDTWLISTSSIHSLSKPDLNHVRKFIRLGWNDYTVEEIYNSIEIL